MGTDNKTTLCHLLDLIAQIILQVTALQLHAFREATCLLREALDRNGIKLAIIAISTIRDKQRIMHFSMICEEGRFPRKSIKPKCKNTIVKIVILGISMGTYADTVRTGRNVIPST